MSIWSGAHIPECQFCGEASRVTKRVGFIFVDLCLNCASKLTPEVARQLGMMPVIIPGKQPGV